MTLKKTRVEYAPLSHRMVLARFGKDQTCALETVDTTGGVLKALTAYMFNGTMPEVGESAAITYGGGDEQFKLTVERINQRKEEPQCGASSKES